MTKTEEKDYSHTHCWNQKQPSACGIPLNKHNQCCLCSTSMPQQNWKEELEEYKCTGYTCRHETSEDHYLIDKDFIEQTLAQQRKEIEADYINWEAAKSYRLKYKGNTDFLKLKQQAEAIEETDADIIIKLSE